MSWEAKPSATTEIPTRDEPYLSEDMKARWTEHLLPRYEEKRGALLPILHDVQDVYRCIPYQAMIEIAVFLELQPADVLDTATFYEEFSIEPLGKYVVAVCQSVACEVCGHQTLLDHLIEKLGVQPHHTTEDGQYTLLALECLGACDGAPCALINDDRHDNLTIEKLDQLLDNLPE